MFGHKRKYNRGRIPRGTWVFGMVERGSGRSLVFRVPNRTRETLVSGLIQHFVTTGTTIISSKFSPYFNLNNLGHIHLMVNHSENFVDPYTRAHTNTIERVWSQVMRKLKAMSGTSKGKLPSYLDEFNWRKVFPRKYFGNVLADIAEFYPPNWARLKKKKKRLLLEPPNAIKIIIPTYILSFVSFWLGVVEFVRRSWNSKQLYSFKQHMQRDVMQYVQIK